MGNYLAKICFLADSHALYDDRIYWKQAVSLVKTGYEVYFILADDVNETGETAEGIKFEKILRDKFPSNLYINYLAKRIPGGLYAKMFRKAASLEADVYHIHDLKVNRIGNKLKNSSFNPKVIYDVHEPYPENILDYWEGKGILRRLRKAWSTHIRKWEKKSVTHYDLIITTEENMQERFRSYFPEKPVEIIYNYTNLSVADHSSSTENKEYDAIYTGGITKFRGAWQILEAVNLAKRKKNDIRILFLGNWFPVNLRKEMETFIKDNDLVNHVSMINAVPYSEVAEYYRKSKIGLGIFLPILTHQIILQIKIFEYMNFGLPIVGSNFGHIKKIIQRHQCGIEVDPEDPEEIAGELLNLLSDEAKYSRMSRNGTRAAMDNYRWDIMEKKLINIYQTLLSE